MAEISMSHEDGELVLKMGEREVTMTSRLDLSQARALLVGLSATLAKMNSTSETQPILATAMLDVLSPTFQIGSDEQGHPILALQVDPLPPFRFRFHDGEAKKIADTFSEIISTPLNIRTVRKLS